MKPSTLKDLKRSIAHWLRMATGKARIGERPDGLHCALCARFALPKNAFGCDGCPVKEKTGLSGCSGTPWQAAYDACHAYGIDSVRFKRAAKKQLAFLRSLLPKKKKKK